jgi:hypothetical protein
VCIVTWGFKGIFKRILELPDGIRSAVSPPGRGRIRYNNTTKQLECSFDGSAWAACGAGGGFTPAYGNLRTFGDGNPIVIAVPGTYVPYDQWQLTDESVNCSPNPLANNIVIDEPGDYIINVTGDYYPIPNGPLQPYFWELFINGVRTRAACAISPLAAGAEGGENGVAITHLASLVATDIVDLRVTSTAGPGSVVGQEMNMNVHKVGDTPVV